MGNCLIGLIYLIVTKRVVKIVCLSTTTKWWPAHYVGLTKKGHVLHYGHILDHKYNTFAPFWYHGKFQGVSKNSVEQALKDSGRYIICEISNLKWFAIFGSIVVGLFVLPVWFYMCVYPIVTLFKGVWQTIKYKPHSLQDI